MSIRAVFRVQCDGLCKGWLSLPADHVLGTDICHVDLVAEPTAVRAGLWPGERAARVSAQGAGWVQHIAHGPWYCPKCQRDPYDVVKEFPPDRGEVAVVLEMECERVGHALNMAGICVFCDQVVVDE